MKRAIVTFLSTLIVGYIALVLGRELLNHIPEYGPIGAIAFSAGLIVYFNEKNKESSRRE